MKMRRMLAGLVALAAGAMIVMPPGTSLAGSVQNSPAFQAASLPPTQQVPQFSSQMPSTSMVRPDYVIGPDDVISVDVFQIPDLSRTVQVDSEGNVLLPLLGSVPAAGRSVSQLSHQIATAYGDKYVRDPKVTVAVKNSESHKVTVNGAVVQPGMYPISSGTTLLQAIALAKGPDTKLASDKVAIFPPSARTARKRCSISAIFATASSRTRRSRRTTSSWSIPPARAASSRISARSRHSRCLGRSSEVRTSAATVTPRLSLL